MRTHTFQRRKSVYTLPRHSWGRADPYFSKKENIHLTDIRTITGLVQGTSHAKLYEESGFTSFKERRKRHKIIMYFKICSNQCPSYLPPLLPTLVSETNPYHRRRMFDRTVPYCRTDLYQRSFFPATTTYWNSQNDNFHQLTSVRQLKQFLSAFDVIVPNQYYLGDRRGQVTLSRLRNNMSNLNHDLFLRHLSADPSCACGHLSENAEHFLLYCPLFSVTREHTIDKLPPHFKTLSILLQGCPTLPSMANKQIITHVHSYLKLSNRL